VSSSNSPGDPGRYRLGYQPLGHVDRPLVSGPVSTPHCIEAAKLDRPLHVVFEAMRRITNEAIFARAWAIGVRGPELIELGLPLIVDELIASSLDPPTKEEAEPPTRRLRQPPLPGWGRAPTD